MNDNLSEDFLTLSSDWWGKNVERTEQLRHEIEYIFDPKIRSLVTMLLAASNAFWEAPISDFEEHAVYPEDEYAPGGIVLHTKRTVNTFVYMESGFFSNLEKDCAIAALLIRNITKAILIDENTYYHDPMHLYTVDLFASSALSGAQTDNDDLGMVLGIDPEAMSLIFRLVRASGGPSSHIPETIPVTELERLVYYADLVSTIMLKCVYGVNYE